MNDKLDYTLLNHPTDLLKRLHKAEQQLADETARADALRLGLEQLADGSTPWLDGYHTEAWEAMAAYAKQLLDEDPTP